MPAEWEPHQGTWLSWPKDPNTFPTGVLQAVEAAYAKMVRALARGEEVRILVDDAKAEARITTQLGRVERVSFVNIKTVDVWTRDYCPIYVRGPDLAVVKWVFNAWGNKYDDLRPDDQAGARVAESTALRVFRPGLVLEGGSVDVNGRGACLTTAQCLLNRNRNPRLDKHKLEKHLLDNLGVRRVVWLGRGISGDDTDGHVDDIARFVDRGKVVCMVENDRHNDNHKPLQENLDVLTRWRGPDDEKLEVVQVEMPDKVESEGPLPASYANFYIGNSAVLLPVYGCRNDDKAIEAISGLFKGRRVVPIDCTELVYGFGAIHCVTQQQPAPLAPD